LGLDRHTEVGHGRRDVVHLQDGAQEPSLDICNGKPKTGPHGDLVGGVLGAPIDFETVEQLILLDGGKPSAGQRINPPEDGAPVTYLMCCGVFGMKVAKMMASPIVIIPSTMKSHLHPSRPCAPSSWRMASANSPPKAFYYISG
jgi:hypothetical protein